MRSSLARAACAAVLMTISVPALAAAPMYDVNSVFQEPHPFSPGGWGYAPGPAPAPVFPTPRYQPVVPSPAYQPTGPLSQPPEATPPAPVIRQAAAPAAPASAMQDAAMSAATSPWYVDVALGYVMVADADLSTGAVNGELAADAGFGGSIALGYQWNESVRFDLELAYRSNDLDQIKVGGFGFTGTADVEGSVDTLAAMVNGYYDVDFGWPVLPYVGAGLGLAQVSIDSSTLSTDDSDTVLAYQGSLGLLYEISPQIAARFGYRLFMTADPEIKNTEGEYTANSFDLGLIYRF